MEDKYCGKCKTLKTVSMFYKNKLSKDGFATKCIECHKKYLQDNKEKIKLKTKQYRLDHKDEIKYSEKKYKEANKEKVAEQKRNYELNNKDKIKEVRSKYRKTKIGRLIQKNKNHTRRAFTKKGDVTTSQLAELQQNAKLCYWCKTSLKNIGTHIDHYIPISKGGKHTISNLVISCKSCNLKKGAKLPSEFVNLINIVE